MESSLLKFFDNGEHKRVDILPHCIAKLKELQKWFDEQRELRYCNRWIDIYNFDSKILFISLLILTYRIYSSSLLFLYDGDVNNSNSTVKMIDFAHVHEVTQYNYIEIKIDRLISLDPILIPFCILDIDQGRWKR